MAAPDPAPPCLARSRLLETPIPRRRALLVMGAGAVAATGGLGALLAGCTGPPITMTLDFDVSTLDPGVPTEIPFTLVTPGAEVEASVWLVRLLSGEVIAYDPRCTHGLCSYAWLDETARFECHCHEGAFALDGQVIEGQPTRALDRWPARVVGATLEMDVPGNFATPRESLED